MALKVGINKNLRIVKAAKNVQGTLVVSFKSATVPNALDALSGKVDRNERAHDMFVYGPKVEFSKGNEDMVEQLTSFREVLELMLEQYTTKDKIQWNPTFGTGITSSEELTKQAGNQDIVDKINNNLVDQFIAQATPFIGENSLALNWIFTRQSANKPYPALRKRFVKSNPFVERMDVPSSRLKFTNYEIGKGLHLGAEGTSDVVSEQDAVEAENLLK